MVDQDEQGVVSQGHASWSVSQLGADTPQDTAHRFSEELGTFVGFSDSCHKPAEQYKKAFSEQESSSTIQHKWLHDHLL